MARPICFMLFMHLARAAASRTFWTAGSRRPIRMAMIAITTNSSISVNAARERRERCDIIPPGNGSMGDAKRESLGRTDEFLEAVGADLLHLGVREGDKFLAADAGLLVGDQRRLVGGHAGDARPRHDHERLTVTVGDEQLAA